MKLLVDNQLPLKLAIHLRTWGLDVVHVLDIGLHEADDLVIWDRACAEGRIVVSKDEDFLILVSRPSDNGRLIWVRLGNCRNSVLLTRFDQEREALMNAITSGQRVIELR